MEASQTTESKKRTLGHMLTADIQGKLKSKQDFFNYFDKHRKYFGLSSLIPL